ncbi:MAG: glycosyl transferase family 1, partial [Geminicoccaceae bacterium]|nr:glycosyl transferase family 1 [Geminicoccaceae bacterium]
VWSESAYRGIRARLRERRYDLVHVHNFFPLISPAVYHAAQAEGCAVVQTLHNYRLWCPAGIFYRDGHVCEDCLGKAVPWPGVVHACYRDSRAGTATVAAMLAGHRLIGTWRSKVDLYIALNEFMRQKAIAGGVPAGKIAIKPNFVSHDPGMGDGAGGFALFAARLNREKGVPELLAAWQRLGPRIPLKIMGDGPLTEEVRRAAAANPALDYLGRRPLAEFYELLGGARFFIFTSTWYEGFPRVISEAYARGTPIVASAIGPIAEVVANGRTGLHFRPGDVDDLVAKVAWLLDHPEEEAALRQNARAEFEAKYTAEVNLEQLLAIYERALASGRGHPAPSAASRVPS